MRKIKLRVYLNDWFYNMGIIGFIRIIDKAGRKKELTIKENYLEFDSNLLNDFHNMYFKYFLSEYDVSRRIRDSLERSLNYLRKNSKNIKEYSENIKKNLKNQADKIKNFNEPVYTEMNDILKKFKEIKKEEDLDLLEGLCKKFFSLIHDKEINERLTLNLYKFIVGDNYFGQPSYFNVVNSKASLEEQKDIMFKDYISKILENGKLNLLLRSADLEDIKSYVKKSLEGKRLNKDIEKVYKQLIKKKNMEQIKSYIEGNDFINCPLCGEYKSSNNYTEYSESNFAPLAVSSNNSKNMFWNLETEYPVCDLCRLILFCTPAGATTINKYNIAVKDRLHSSAKSEKAIKFNDFFYQAFVNLDSSLNNLLDANEQFRENKNSENPFSQLIFNIVTESVEISKWQLQNILFIEFKSSVSKKSCEMNYFNIPKYTAEFFVIDGVKVLNSIYNTKFKAALVDNILKNIDLKTLTNDELRKKIREEDTHGYECFLACKARHILNCYKGGKKEVDDKKMKAIYYSGRELHDYFKEYNQNKITPIAYKLLNAAKVRNKSEFMDTILRVYMSADRSIPQIFLQIMSEKELDFETIAHSFVSGLISEKYEANSNEEVI